MKRNARKPKKQRAARRLRAVSDELGVTTPKKRRTSAGKKPAPRARPRTIR